MSASLDPQAVLKKRLLRPLPTPGASKRVRAIREGQPATEAPVSSETTATPSGDNQSTPKASTQDLPPPSEATTPKVPVIRLNDGPVVGTSESSALFIVDEAKDAELREKFLKLQLHEPQKRVVPRLKIPKKAKPPPKPMQRQMARVKPAVKTAPRPEISFGTTVTTFGSGTGEGSKVDSEKQSEPVPVNLQALKRRQNREKQERLRISHKKPRLPPTLAEGNDVNTVELEQDDVADDSDGTGDEGDDNAEERKRQGREKMKQITLMMARDIQQWNIPKSKLKEMAKGKTEEETAARRRVLEMAWKLAKRQQDKEKRNKPAKRELSQVVEDPNTDEPESDKPERPSKKSNEEKTLTQGEKRRKAKGKERALAGSAATPLAATTPK